MLELANTALVSELPTCNQSVDLNLSLLKVVGSATQQARIQDFEMGGEFSPPQSEKSEKSNIISIFEGKEKKKGRRGSEKGG